MTRATVLVVDDDDALRELLGVLLRVLGHDVLVAPDVPTAKALLGEHWVDLVISDLRMPGGSGFDLLDWIRLTGIDTPVIIVTAHGTTQMAAEAIRKGAFDFTPKPFDITEIGVRIGRALEWKRASERDRKARALPPAGGCDRPVPWRRQLKH